MMEKIKDSSMRVKRTGWEMTANQRCRLNSGSGEPGGAVTDSAGPGRWERSPRVWVVAVHPEMGLPFNSDMRGPAWTTGSFLSRVPFPGRSCEWAVLSASRGLESLECCPHFHALPPRGPAFLYPPLTAGELTSHRRAAGALLGASGSGAEKDAEKRIEATFNLRVCSTFCL